MLRVNLVPRRRNHEGPKTRKPLSKKVFWGVERCCGGGTYGPGMR